MSDIFEPYRVPAGDRRRKYEIRDEATWALVRKAYLSGLSAQECAERFDVSVHAIRKRITMEGWGKRAFINAVGPGAAAEDQPAEPLTLRWAKAPSPLEVEIEPARPVEAPGCPADMAEAAFAKAAEAFAAGRVEAAQRLLKLAGEARRMADAEARRPAPASAAPPDAAEAAPVRLEKDEVIITLDQLFSMTERWAELMILGELRDLPCVMIHLAAHWRRANLPAPMLYGHDILELREHCRLWFHEVFEPDGALRPLPEMDQLARYVWGHRDFPDLAQVPPKLMDGG